jgi:hypothetical protein
MYDLARMKFSYVYTIISCTNGQRDGKKRRVCIMKKLTESNTFCLISIGDGFS